MKGYIVILQNGNELHFPECTYWKKNGDRLDLKEDSRGDKIARFNWDAVVCVHQSDDVEHIQRNTN